MNRIGQFCPRLKKAKLYVKIDRLGQMVFVKIKEKIFVLKVFKDGFGPMRPRESGAYPIRASDSEGN